jgi:hypothetical protein
VKAAVGKSLKDGTLFDSMKLREKRNEKVSVFWLLQAEGLKRKEKKILQVTRKDVHWFPLIE